VHCCKAFGSPIFTESISCFTTRPTPTVHPFPPRKPLQGPRFPVDQKRSIFRCHTGHGGDARPRCQSIPQRQRPSPLNSASTGASPQRRPPMRVSPPHHETVGEAHTSPAAPPQKPADWPTPKLQPRGPPPDAASTVLPRHEKGTRIGECQTPQTAEVSSRRCPDLNQMVTKQREKASISRQL